MLIRTVAFAALFVVAACDPKIKIGDLDGRNATNNACLLYTSPSPRDRG